MSHFKAWFTLDGLDDYLKKIQQAGKDIDAAVDKALDASAEIVYQDMKRNAPKETGNLEAHIRRTEPMTLGTFHFVIIELDLKDRSALYGVYHEFGYRVDTVEKGADGQKVHKTKLIEARPWFRPAFDNNRAKVKRKQREILKEVIGS